MSIFFVLLFFPLLCAQALYSSDPGTISWYLKELNDKMKYSYAFAFSEKQINATDDRKLIEIKGDVKVLITGAQKELTRMYQDVEANIAEKGTHRREFFGTTYFKILSTIKQDKMINCSIPVLQLLSKNIKKEMEYLRPLINRKYLPERAILRVFRPLPGGIRFGNDTPIYYRWLGAGCEKIQGKEKEVLDAHHAIRVISRAISYYLSDANIEFGFCPGKRCYKSHYGPWHFFPKTDPSSYLKVYDINGDPRVQALPKNATDEEKVAALYQNPFSPRLWDTMKVLRLEKC